MTMSVSAAGAKEQTPAIPRVQRRAGVEWLRLAACFGVVLFHLEAAGGRIGVGGLAAFMVVAIAFAALPSRETTTGKIWSTRFRRLGWPWLFWSAIYTLAKIAQAVVEGRGIATEFNWSMLLTGPRIHLWYLPFALVLTALARDGVRRGVVKLTPPWLFGYALSSVVLIPLSAWLARATADIIPLHQWIFMAPAIPIGLALAGCSAVHRRGAGLPLWIGGAVLIGWAGAWFLQAEFALETWGLAPPYVAGVGACLIAWYAPFSAGPRLCKLSDLAFGAYLSHLLVASALPIVGVDLPPWPQSLLVFAISMAIAATMKMTPARRFV